MARHSLFPNSITINYTSNSHSHKQILPIAAVTPSGGTWNVTLRDDSALPWKTAVDAYVALMADILDTTATIDSADLYDYEATDSPAIFLDSYSIAVSGTTAGSPAEFGQMVMPFKALGGTSLRLTIMEGVAAEDERQTYAGSSFPEFVALADYILGDDDFIITRGGTYPAASLGFTTKENDKLRKRYFLN